MRYEEFGLNNYWKRSKVYKTTGECLLKYHKNGLAVKWTKAPLKLKQFYVPFALLLFGYIMGILIFAREKKQGLVLVDTATNTKVTDDVALLLDPAIYSVKYFW